MRLAVLAHDRFDPRGAKTAHSVLKYAREGWSGDEVVAVVDRAKAGKDASVAVGEAGRGIPIVASVKEALAHRPEALVIGIAPAGGALPRDWLPDLQAALERGLTVVSGLHTPLAQAPELAAWKGLIRDVRHEHPPLRITTGAALGVEALVVTAVGTDCNSGKMTASIELAREARRRGLKAAFVATGQTGIMVGCDAGAPLDALVSDFVAGVMEQLVLDAAKKEPDVIFVEGQGSITHPAYSGVTASLLHGSFPDVLLLADEPRREFLTLPPDAVRFVKNTAARERDLNEAHMAPTTQARVGAVAMLTRGLSDDEYLAERETMEKEMGVPAGDCFRGDAPRVLDGLLAEAARRGLWGPDGFVRGVKSARLKKGVV